jgi:uncharacterized protein
MRDGANLKADVLRPEIDAKVPAIVIRTPYGKDGAFGSAISPGLTLAKAGFAVVAQDVRGRFSSDGDWPPKSFWGVEGPDGYDTVEWSASQDWCDGNVGMCGNSYLAECQYAAASLRPPSLRAIAPGMHALAQDDMRLFPWMLESIILTYAAGMAVDTIQRKMATGEANMEHALVAMDVIRDPAGASRTLPVASHPMFNLPGVVTYADVVHTIVTTFNHDGQRGAGIFDVPALMTTGWFDSQLGGARMFPLFRETGATEAARNETRLIIGAWTHNYQLSFVGEIGLSGFGSAEGAMIPQAHVDFFSRHLRGDDPLPLPMVRYFVMGTNEWKVADDWPIPGTDNRRMYTSSNGNANSLRGDGTLSWDAPPSGQSPDTFVYDPTDPVASVGGRVMYTGGSTLAGPYNQQRIEQREDVLVYTSETMSRPLEIAGLVEVHLVVSSSAPDTDFVVKLCDVDADGVSINIADGITRARYRESWDEPSFLEPGEPARIRVDLGATGHCFLPGHRVRVTVTSSGFPHWQRNMNTTGDPGLEATAHVAHQTVFHDADAASYVVLPVQEG